MRRRTPPGKIGLIRIGRSWRILFQEVRSARAKQVRCHRKMMNEPPCRQDRLSELESVLETNQRSFYQVGRALREIRDDRLYERFGFSRFEDYTRTRWEMRKSQAYRLIDASMVIDNLSPIGERLPVKEAHARPLTKLKPFDQRKVWREFLSSGVRLSAVNIGRFVSRYMGPKRHPVGSDQLEIISPNYKSAVSRMLYEIRLARNDRWESTSRQTALYWNKVMKERILWGR